MMPQVSQFKSFLGLRGDITVLQAVPSFLSTTTRRLYLGPSPPGASSLVVHARKRGELLAPFYNGLIYPGEVGGKAGVIHRELGDPARALEGPDPELVTDEPEPIVQVDGLHK